MTDETKHGFPIGRVAATLRKILSPDLNAHGVEAVTVCLLSHLLVERSINQTLYSWLKLDAPLHADEPATKRADEELWNSIVKMDFAKKFSLLEPHFSLFFPGLNKRVWAVNQLRNDIFHGRAIENAKFNGKPISKEQTVEEVFICAQEISMQMDKFWELIDSPHAFAEKWRDRLQKLGEPLF